MVLRLGITAWAVLLAASGLEQGLGQDASAVKQFQELEDKWSVATAHRDQFALENLLEPAMVDVSAAAEISTRNQLIAKVLNGEPEPVESILQRVVNVRVVSDMAVVEGTYTLQLKEGSKLRDERGVFTHVWEHSRGGWACLSAQRTAVVDQVEGAVQKARAEKKSGAGEPFHIPLVLKGSQPKQPEATPPVTGNPDH